MITSPQEHVIASLRNPTATCIPSLHGYEATSPLVHQGAKLDRTQHLRPSIPFQLHPQTSTLGVLSIPSFLSFHFCSRYSSQMVKLEGVPHTCRGLPTAIPGELRASSLPTPVFFPIFRPCRFRFGFPESWAFGSSVPKECDGS